MCLDCQGIRAKDKTLLHEIPGKQWKTFGADVFSLNHKHFLCVVDYHSTYPVNEQVEGYSADNLIKYVRSFLQNTGFLVDK